MILDVCGDYKKSAANVALDRSRDYFHGNKVTKKINFHNIDLSAELHEIRANI